MSNFIFSIQEIFTKCLDEHKVSGYYIGPYQRGYKWKSKTIHDQVSVLLSDLYDAFLKKNDRQSNTEYYLQYITVKKTKQNGNEVFEVIDGQQRLTTLTLLFNMLEKYFETENIAKKSDNYLLQYSRYLGAETNIFDVIHNLLDESTTDIEKVEEQDKFYLYGAAKTIHTFFKILKENDGKKFIPFIDFIKNDVKIILNKEDEFTSAEEVFSSLNANKVPLTNAYLIKGLLLTKASRISIAEGQKKHFKEIMDERTMMAKTWDEMHNWFSRPDVGKYFFGNENAGMDVALSLIQHPKINSEHSVIELFRNSLESSGKKFENQYELFNQFHENITTSGDAFDYLFKIKHLYKRLRNWYEDNNWYNLLGYYLHTDGKLKIIIDKNHKELSKKLNEHLVNQITYSVKEKGIFIEKEFSILHYENNPYKKINKMLLALSVFPEGIDRRKEQNYRFDFFSYSKEGWSLEHIFPQNPGSKPIDFADDKDWLIKQCRKNEKDDLVKKIQNNEPLMGDDLSFIYNSFPDVHILGNMALLSSSVNSALSNGLFNTKRKILLKKLNNGSFVPKHTIDVFAKMLEAKEDEEGSFIEFDKDMIIWSEQDAAAHLNWIKSRIKQLKNEFTV
jgi:hypothetical protein